ncbi:Kunitz/Bovine pancreatic trypsin inhibitor domain protein, partial [Teladorsagia circumcincta]
CNVSEDHRFGLERSRNAVRPTISARCRMSVESIKESAVPENVSKFWVSGENKFGFSRRKLPNITETICAQPLRVGDCTENVKRYWYNAKARQCQMFEYTGCPYGGTPLRDHSGMVAVCSGQEDCPSSHECSPVVVGHGSINRCCPTRDGCPPGNFVFINDAGDTATCDPFNPPNAPCPESFTCQWSTSNQSPKAKQCPHGYSCQINTKRTQYICCSTPELTSQVCPSGRVPYLINGLPQRCTKQRCPRGYECTYKDHDYLCCSSAGKISGKQQSSTSTAGPTGVVEKCPRGNPLIYPSTRLPVVCTPGKKSCPIGFACQQSISSEQFICCPSRYRMSAFP